MIGVIADDVTGASDVAVAFRRGGLSAALYFGVPSPEAHVPSVDVIVIALTTRMASPTEAVSRSLLALDWLLAHGTSQTYFKYCSTFDSTADGNIGPVLDALRERLAVTTVVTTPSSPEHGRTQYLGHLFVGDQLLSDSPMRDHPVTPMRDSNLGRLLATQSTGTIGLIDAPAVWAGKAEVQRRIAEAENDHTATVFVDATSHDDLRTIGGAVVDAVLLAGAAGLAEGFAEAVAKKKKRPAQPIGSVRLASARTAVIAGSCSKRTLEQIRYLTESGRAAYRIDVLAQPDPYLLAQEALEWYDALDSRLAPLFFSSLPAEQLRMVQETFGVAQSAAVVERATALIAIQLVERGVRRLICAGGETSGAVLSALRVEGGVVGDEAERGVPWIYSPTHGGLQLLLKSGNFGEPSLLADASATESSDQVPGCTDG